MLQVTYTEGELRLLEAANIAEANESYSQSAYLHDCGTPACMLGGYAKAHPESWGFRFGTPYRRGSDGNPWGWSGLGVTEEFGITDEEADRIFNAEGCGRAGRNGKKAAAYVRKFVEKRVKARLAV